jgi:hypothetical protein
MKLSGISACTKTYLFADHRAADLDIGRWSWLLAGRVKVPWILAFEISYKRLRGIGYTTRARRQIILEATWTYSYPRLLQTLPWLLQNIYILQPRVRFVEVYKDIQVT